MLRTAPDGRKYLSDPDEPGKYLLLDQSDGKKFTHEQVRYGPGHGGEFCRSCEYSDHAKPKPHCKYVTDIERDGWCILWDKEDRKLPHGAKQAKDGEYYVSDSRRPGKFLRVDRRPPNGR